MTRCHPCRLDNSVQRCRVERNFRISKTNMIANPMNIVINLHKTRSGRDFLHPFLTTNGVKQIWVITKKLFSNTSV